MGAAGEPRGLAGLCGSSAGSSRAVTRPVVGTFAARCGAAPAVFSGISRSSAASIQAEAPRVFRLPQSVTRGAGLRRSPTPCQLLEEATGGGC